MRYSELIEGEVVSLAQVKKDRTKAKVGGLVDAFKALEAQWAAYKAEHGTFQPMMDDYEANPAERNVPRFYVHVQFDHMASAEAKKRLAAQGFEFSTDDPHWGTEIHDDENTRSFTHGAYMKPRQKNWYTQSEAFREVTKEEALSLFGNRNQNTYGLYRGNRPHYHKGNLTGSTKTGWDIRTHPEYSQHYLNGMAWWVEFRAPDYSEDAIIVDEAIMAEAVRVYDMIVQAERIRKSGANVTRLFEAQQHQKFWLNVRTGEALDCAPEHSVYAIKNAERLGVDLSGIPANDQKRIAQGGSYSGAIQALIREQMGSQGFVSIYYGKKQLAVNGHDIKIVRKGVRWGVEMFGQVDRVLIDTNIPFPVLSGEQEDSRTWVELSGENIDQFIRRGIARYW